MGTFLTELQGFAHARAFTVVSVYGQENLAHTHLFCFEANAKISTKPCPKTVLRQCWFRRKQEWHCSTSAYGLALFNRMSCGNLLNYAGLLRWVKESTRSTRAVAGSGKGTAK